MDTIGALTVSSGVCSISRHQSVPRIKFLMYFGAFSGIFEIIFDFWFIFGSLFLMIFHLLAFFSSMILYRFFIKFRMDFGLIFDVF